MSQRNAWIDFQKKHKGKFTRAEMSKAYHKENGVKSPKRARSIQSVKAVRSVGRDQLGRFTKSPARVARSPVRAARSPARTIRRRSVSRSPARTIRHRSVGRSQSPRDSKGRFTKSPRRNQ